MGQFSWLDCCDTSLQILDNIPADVYVLVPDEFVETYGRQIKETCYDGYGDFGRYDIYELVADWNKNYIDCDTFTSKSLDAGTPDSYGGLWDSEKDELRKAGFSASEIEKLNKKRQLEYYNKAVERSNKGMQAIKDFCAGKSDSYMKKNYGANYKREIGIHIACYDQDNAKLKYPIKITHYAGGIYENCKPSPSDPAQGWFSANRYIWPHIIKYLENNNFDLLCDAESHFSVASLKEVDLQDFTDWLSNNPAACEDLIEHLQGEVVDKLWDYIDDYDFGTENMPGRFEAVVFIDSCAEDIRYIELPYKFDKIIAKDLSEATDQIQKYLNECFDNDGIHFTFTLENKNTTGLDL